MRGALGLAVAAVLAWPAGGLARERPSWVATDGDQDAVRVTVLDVRAAPRPHGRRAYLALVRYEWLAGQPVVAPWDWRARRANGRWLHVARTGARRALPVVVLSERGRRAATGWLAWRGMADPSRVMLVMTRDRRRWEVPARA